MTETVKHLLREAKDTLAAEQATDGMYLLAFVTGLTRATLMAHPEKTIEEVDVASYREALQRLHQGEPLAYIAGQKAFWDLDLAVTPDVLIPRPETECVVQACLDALGDEQNLRILDLGTGSGAVALAIARERPAWQVVGVDKSDAALAVAQANCQKYALGNASFVESDWFSALAGESFDIIVANPPYIAADDPHLQTGIRFEPHSALVAEGDGFADYARIIRAAPAHLRGPSLLVFEHGHTQQETLCDMLEVAGFRILTRVKDLAEQPRGVVAVF